MKGLELSRAFYEEYGKSMLSEGFSELLPYIAVGLAGSGSECYGYDDEFSRDHDFEPGFCIFIPDDIIDRKTAFGLSRAYEKLPREFMGYKRGTLSPVGGARHGVISIGDFFESKTGKRDGSLSVADWFSIPEYSLSEAVNGDIFYDGPGLVSDIRQGLSYFPEDVRLKKLAGHLLLMGQAGQYNYTRCLKRGETGAAQLAAFEFAKSAMNALFLINRVYMPYYKWSFRALRELTALGELAFAIEELITTDNSPSFAKRKADTIEGICLSIGKELERYALSDCESAEMEMQAYKVNETIKDNNIRNSSILYGV